MATTNLTLKSLALIAVIAATLLTASAAYPQKYGCAPGDMACRLNEAAAWINKRCLKVDDALTAIICQSPLLRRIAGAKHMIYEELLELYWRHPAVQARISNDVREAESRIVSDCHASSDPLEKCVGEKLVELSNNLNDRAGDLIARRDPADVPPGWRSGSPSVSPPASAPLTGPTEIPLMQTRNSYMLPASINTVPVNFLLDTGADVVCLPRETVVDLIRRGGLRQDDVGGFSEMGNAHGDSRMMRNVMLREIAVGDRVVRNVRATVGCADALLGQNFLRRFGSYTIDNRRNVLVLESAAATR